MFTACLHGESFGVVAVDLTGGLVGEVCPDAPCQLETVVDAADRGARGDLLTGSADCTDCLTAFISDQLVLTT